MRLVYYIAILAILFLSCNNRRNEMEKEVWTQISQYFEPSSEFKDVYGAYRSPLVFENGDIVTNKIQWEQRRAEILSTWHHKMGEWPELLRDNPLEILEEVDSLDFKQYKVRFKWLPQEYTEGYLLVPKGGEEKKPAVVTVFYEPETSVGLSDKPYRDYAYQLVKRGYVTMSLGTAEASKNKTYSLFYPNIDSVTIQPLSTLAYAAANAWQMLAQVKEVDSTRIGIVGHSFGGKWAMFASCLYDKFACAAWSDPGIVFDETKGSYVNYWEPWYLGYYPPPWKGTWAKTGENKKGVYANLVAEGYDLHELHALMAPRPFLVSGGSSDPQERWIPLNHTIKVNNLLGYKNRVAMTNRKEHSGNYESNEQIYMFFDYFLKYRNL